PPRRGDTPSGGYSILRIVGRANPWGARASNDKKNALAPGAARGVGRGRVGESREREHRFLESLATGVVAQRPDLAVLEEALAEADRPGHRTPRQALQRLDSILVGEDLRRLRLARPRGRAMRGDGRRR